MFTREQDPASLASADFARSAAEKTADEEVISSLRQFSPKLHVGDLQALARARRQEAEKAKARAKMAATSRHSRWWIFPFILSCLTLQISQIRWNLRVEEREEHHGQRADCSETTAESARPQLWWEKASSEKVKERDDTRTQRSTLPVRIFLKEFCVKFLHQCWQEGKSSSMSSECIDSNFYSKVKIMPFSVFFCTLQSCLLSAWIPFRPHHTKDQLKSAWS